MDKIIIDSYENLPNDIKTKLHYANAFFQYEFMVFSTKMKKSTLYAYNNNFIMPVQFAKRILFRYCVLATEPYSLSGSADYSLFLDKCIDELKKFKIHWLINTVSSEFKYVPKDSKWCNFGTYIIDLSQDIATIWGNIESKHKNSIRRSEREKVEVIEGGVDLIEKYIEIDRQTRQRSNLKQIENSYFKNLLESMGGMVRIFLAIDENGNPQAGAVIYFNKSKGYYINGASKNKSIPGSANLLLWRIIEILKANSVKEFSFVGYRHNVNKESKFYGIQRFKEKFGGDLKSTFLFRYEYNKLLYNCYSWLIGSISKRRIARYDDIVDQINKGEH